ALGRSAVRPVDFAPPEFSAMTPAADATACQIALFRPFRKDTSRMARALLSILQGYGTVNLVGDPTFDEAVESGIFRRSDSKVDHAVVVHRFADVWKPGVRELIEGADVAILDVSIIGAGVVWEIAQCYDVLPEYRVMLVLSQAALAGRNYHAFVGELYTLLR